MSSQHPQSSPIVGGRSPFQNTGVLADRAASGPEGSLRKSKLGGVFSNCSAVRPDVSNRKGSGKSASVQTPYSLESKRKSERKLRNIWN